MPPYGRMFTEIYIHNYVEKSSGTALVFVVVVVVIVLLTVNLYHFPHLHKFVSQTQHKHSEWMELCGCIGVEGWRASPLGMSGRMGEGIGPLFHAKSKTCPYHLCLFVLIADPIEALCVLMTCNLLLYARLPNVFLSFPTMPSGGQNHFSGRPLKGHNVSSFDFSLWVTVSKHLTNSGIIFVRTTIWEWF